MSVSEKNQLLIGRVRAFSEFFGFNSRFFVAQMVGLVFLLSVKYHK